MSFFLSSHNEGYSAYSDTATWVHPSGVSYNGRTPKSSLFIFFHYKPSISRVPRIYGNPQVPELCPCRSPFPGNTPIAGASAWKDRCIGPVWPASRIPVEAAEGRNGSIWRNPMSGDSESVCAGWSPPVISWFITPS